MSARYKVAHVNLSRNYGPSERQTELLIAALARTGISQILVCRENSYMLNNLKSIPNIKAVKIQGSGDVMYMGHVKLGKLASIVHAHEIEGFKWASLHYMLFGIPYVLTVRGLSCIENSLPVRLLYTWASKVVGISKSLNKQVKESYDINPVLIPDCHSKLAPHQPTVIKIKELFKDKFVVCHIGPLVNKSSNNYDLIEVAQLLEIRMPQLIVLFVGLGSDFENLKDKATGIPNIKFISEIKNASDYAAAADVYIYPSLEETALGNNPLDMMSQGISVVAIDNGTLPDIIRNEETALVVPEGNPQALADAIYRIKTDRTLVDNLKTNAKKEISFYSAENMAANYINIYQSIGS